MFDKDIKNKLIQFIYDRNWDTFHTEENLAKAISCEASELLKNYIWGDEWPYKIKEENKKEEIADILIFCFYYINKKGYNINKIVNEKIEKNIKKYKEK